MTRRYLKIVLVGSLFTLSACAQQSEVREMKQSVNTLNVAGNDSNLLIVFYVQIMPDDFVMQLHRF
ncbi:protein YajI [Enterobacter hormaechei]|nr:protein YajI [Enterobacter hormaechei]